MARSDCQGFAHELQSYQENKEATSVPEARLKYPANGQEQKKDASGIAGSVLAK